MTENALAERPAPLDLALLKAVGLDKAAPEQRQLAISIAERYELDLLLKHLVLIEGRPYLTRDALLHIAHRSGQFDGIGTTTPEVVGDEWRCTATVWRKDMSHPFVSDEIMDFFISLILISSSSISMISCGFKED